MPAHGSDRVQCSVCGEPLSAGANYCPRCGQPTGVGFAPGNEAPAASRLGSEFWVPSAAAGLGPQFGPPSAVQHSQPVPLFRRRPLQIAIVAAVVAVGAIAVAIASTGSGHKSPSEPLAAPAGPDGVTTYKAAHFSAKFPSTPVETQVPTSVGNLHFVIHLAAVRAPNLEMIEEADFSPALPDSAIDTNLRATLASFAASAGMTLVSQSVTTFQGYPARHGSISSATGQQFDAIAFITGGSREYMLVGPTGSAYDALAASFTILP